MKPVQNSDDKEETDSLLLQSNLEYSNSKYASASVFNNIWLRMASEEAKTIVTSVNAQMRLFSSTFISFDFDERNQGDVFDYETTRLLNHDEN